VLSLQAAFLSLAGLISVFFGVRYFVAKAFMPYHAVVAGKAWSELEQGTQTIILAMLKIIGGGFAAYGIALLWMLMPLISRAPWAPYAILTTSAVVLVPTLYVTVALKRAAPSARTPVVPACVVIALVLLGSVPSIL
jgi:uncharacterized protein YjeT (DUF2065 family)